MKKIFKKTAAVLLAAAMALSVAACGQPAANQSAPVSAATESAASERVVTDHLGREVAVTKLPERIVSGYYITSSLLIALGLSDKTVGIEAKAKTRPIYALAAPEMLKLPSVGTAKEFDLEGCLALKPDLVILPIKLKDSASVLEKAGVAVICVNPEDDKGLRETVKMLGTLTGTEERAAALLAYYDEKLASVKAKTALSLAKAPRVYLAGNSSMLSTATAEMYQNTLITNAGGVNVAGEIDDSYWATVSYEQLLAWNPDTIIIVPFAAYTKEDVQNDPRLAGLKAVKYGAVYQMPTAFEAWDSPVPSGILGTMWLASVLHEDSYPIDDFKKEAASFYKEFYDVEIDAALITK